MVLKRHTAMLIGAFFLIFLLCADLLAGGIPDATVFWKLRVPRILTAVLAGSALSAGGAQMQSIFRNPLADPHIMGISGGAGLGAAVATLALGTTGSHVLGIAVSAFIGAILASMLILFIAGRIRSGNTLLIAGVMLGFIFSALVSILEYTANEEALKLYFGWAAGNFTGLSYQEIALLLGAVLAGLYLAFQNHKGLDLMLFGDIYTELSGADSRRIRFSAVLSCSLMTAAVTAFCGPIGFVGIIAPQCAGRVLRTRQHRRLLPASLLVGALFTLTADLLAHLSGKPLPVGSTVALLGIPVIFMLLRNNRP